MNNSSRDSYKKLRLIHLPSQYQVADLLRKSFTTPSFNRFRNKTFINNKKILP